MSEWKKKCEDEWKLQGAPMPDSLDWKAVYEAKPLGRNLLKNPSPLGLSKDNPPPEPNLPDAPPVGPPVYQPDGDFTGWTTSTTMLPFDRSGIPPDVVVCFMPQNLWFSLEQLVDLKAEGLWEELLDGFQPEIAIEDCYEWSRVDDSIYQLHVKLLGADKSTVISEHTVNPTEVRSVYSHTWKEVSHVFSGYGPGVRYVHFSHQVKNQYMEGLFPTLFASSSVIVRPTKTSSLAEILCCQQLI